MNTSRRNFLKLGGCAAIVLPGIGVISSETEMEQDNQDNGDLWVAGDWRQVLKRVEEFQIKKHGILLANHPAIKKSQDIVFSRELFHMYAARAWGYSPSELRQKSLADRIDIYAWYIAEQQIKEVVYYDEMRKRSRKRNGR